MANSKSTSFAEWMRQVDRIIGRTIGLYSSDLPDCCFADWYEDGVKPATAAFRAIRRAKE